MSHRPIVLICEDEPIGRDVLARRLESRGYDTHTVADGIECLDWLATNRCDLILMDAAMPRMDGIECVRRIRQTFSHDTLPVIMVSALVDSDDVIAGLEAGANDYVVKPINLPVLEARMRNCLKIRGAVSALVEAERQRVMIETLGRSAARLAEPISRMIDTLEHLTTPAENLPLAASVSAERQVEEVLNLVEEVVGVMEKLQAAGRDADLPYSRRIDLLIDGGSGRTE